MQHDHFQYLTWPDKGVPDEDDFSDFLENVIMPNILNSSRKVIIHCSAGVGRTGAIAVILAAINEISHEPTTSTSANEAEDIVVKIMKAYRLQRDQHALVQMPCQLAFVYKFLLKYFEKMTGR